MYLMGVDMDATQATAAAPTTTDIGSTEVHAVPGPESMPQFNSYGSSASPPPPPATAPAPLPSQFGNVADVLGMAGIPAMTPTAFQNFLPGMQSSFTQYLSDFGPFGNVSNDDSHLQ